MNDKESHSSKAKQPSQALVRSLWSVQVLLFITFAGGGVWKLATPRDEIAKLMPWVGEVAPGFFYMTAFFDLLGGVGILIPSLMGIQPKLTQWAALGCLALQICAIAFHMSRGEAADTPFNFFLVALSAFVFWGRRTMWKRYPD